MSSVADYLTINISSPNTPGLRRLQDEGALQELLAAIREARSTTPIFLKVAPDLNDGDPERIEEDVRQGFVSRRQAARDYQVVFQPHSCEIDRAATNRRPCAGWCRRPCPSTS